MTGCCHIVSLIIILTQKNGGISYGNEILSQLWDAGNK